MRCVPVELSFTMKASEPPPCKGLVVGRGDGQVHRRGGASDKDVARRVGGDGIGPLVFGAAEIGGKQDRVNHESCESGHRGRAQTRRGWPPEAGTKRARGPARAALPTPTAACGAACRPRGEHQVAARVQPQRRRAFDVQHKRRRVGTGGELEIVFQRLAIAIEKQVDAGRRMFGTRRRSYWRTGAPWSAAAVEAMDLPRHGIESSGRRQRGSGALETETRSWVACEEVRSRMRSAVGSTNTE